MKQKLDSLNFAIAAASIMAIITFFATTLALVVPTFTTLTPIIEIIYGHFGYSISTLGIVLGTIYAFIDTFIIIYIFAWLYNKLP